MKIHSPPEKINLPKSSKNVQLDKASEVIASLPLGTLGLWTVAVSFGHQTFPKMDEKERKRPPVLC